LVRAWKLRTARLNPHFHQTDILGALQLASEIFVQQPGTSRRTLVLFSDMRQSASDLNFESQQVVPPFLAVARRCGTLPALRNVQVYVLGVDGDGRSAIYWRSLQNFWAAYFHNAAADLQSYSVLRELPDGAELR